MGWLRRSLRFRRKPHVHSAYAWDGYYEHCRCGAFAGDRRSPITGMRYVTFSQWPLDALVVNRRLTGGRS